MKNRFWLTIIPIVQFIKRLTAAKNISGPRIFLLVTYFIKLIIVMPFAVLQFLIYGRRINKTVIGKQPIFILGHYRSGTTYLHKLISADPRFGFISSYDIIGPNSNLLFGKWLQQFLQFVIGIFGIRTSFYNNSILDLKEPAEEERFLINKGSAFTDYWRFVFPLCWNKWQSCAALSKDATYFKQWKKEYMWLMKMATFKHQHKQLVLKSPPNTGRIKYLLEIFPGAKFIYISRNPYHVFYSTCNMWNKAIARFRLQEISETQMEEIVFSEYIALIEAYKSEKDLVPGGNLIEVAYEELEDQPLDVLKNIYAGLQLPDFEIARKALFKKLAKENKYQKFEYKYNDAVFKKIEARWGKYINEWKRQSNTNQINEHSNAYEYENNCGL
jgi:hypothetical protein